MARIRTVKQAFFLDWDLYRAEVESAMPLRLAFESLWPVADREGRFRWKPEELKPQCLPHDDLDFGEALEALWAAGFVEKYEVDGKVYGRIPSWGDHQLINQREAQSVLPSHDEATRIEPQSPSTGFVYVALAERARAAKIGFTRRDPRACLHDLSCGSPEELRLAMCFVGTLSDEIELRKCMGDCFARREWIQWDETISERIATSAASLGLTASDGFSRVTAITCNARQERKGTENGNGVGKGSGESAEPRRVSTPTTGLRVRVEDGECLLTFPVIGTNGHEWRLRRRQVEEWAALYPGLDVIAECRHALAWVQANPGRRKTSSGMPRFLTNWLNRTVDRRGTGQPSADDGRSRLTQRLAAASQEFLES